MKFLLAAYTEFDITVAKINRRPSKSVVIEYSTPDGIERHTLREGEPFKLWITHDAGQGGLTIGQAFGPSYSNPEKGATR